MSTQVLTNCKIYYHNIPIDSSVNAVALNFGAEQLDDTVFGDATRSMKGGLKTVLGNIEGFWDAATPDSQSFTRIGTTTNPLVIQIIPSTAAEGDVGYVFDVTQTNYTPGGRLGEMLGFSVELMANDGPLVRGTVTSNVTDAAATANGSGYQLGALTSAQKLYAGIVTTKMTATSVDYTIESDDNAGFTSPTTRITMTNLATIGSSWGNVAGAITDDYWRVVYTINGAGLVSFTSVLGII